MASWLFTPSAFEVLVDKATSPLLPIGTHDVATNFDVADAVRAKTAPPRAAAQTLKRKLQDRNPNVQLLALRLLDSCIKNGGDHFLAEVGTKEYVDVLTGLLKSSPNHDVKNLALDLFQQWALTFSSKNEFSYLVESYNTLKTSGISFPPPPPVSLSLSASAFTSTSTLPAWSDSAACQRCRTPFSFTNRKHHCRNCGRVFDQLCSAHTLALPWYGVAEPVRVCDGCWHKKGKVKVDAAPAAAKAGPAVPGKKEVRRGGREDTDLARAIALSLAEANAASAGGGARGFVQAPAYGSEPPLVEGGRRATAVDRSAGDEEEDDDLRAAIEASLREMASAPSAPPPLAGSADDETEAFGSGAPAAPHPWELPANEEDAVLTFAQTVDLAGRAGGDLRRFPGVDELAANARGVADGRVRGGTADVENRQRILQDMQAKLTQAVGLYDRLQTERAALVDRQRREDAQRRLAQMQQQQQQQAYNPYAPQPGWGHDPYAQPQQQPSPYYAPAGPAHAYGPPPPMQHAWSGCQQQHQPYQQQQPQPPQGMYPQMPAPAPVEPYVNGQAPVQHAPPPPSPQDAAGPSHYPSHYPSHQPPQHHYHPEQQQQQHHQPPPQPQPESQQQEQPSYPVEPYPEVTSASGPPPPPPEDNAWATEAPFAPLASPSAVEPTGAVYPALHAGQPLYSPPTSPVHQQHQPPFAAPSSPFGPTSPVAAPQQQAPQAAFPTAPLSQPLSSAFPAVPDGPLELNQWADAEQPPAAAHRKEEAPLIEL